MVKNIDFGLVADLQDAFVQWDLDVPFLRAMSAGVSGEVCELMSGTGRLSIPLLEGGVRSCCVDYSARMLDVLRRKLRERGLAADVPPGSAGLSKEMEHEVYLTLTTRWAPASAAGPRPAVIQ
jgi:hypothetical protein